MEKSVSLSTEQEQSEQIFKQELKTLSQSFKQELENLSKTAQEALQEQKKIIDRQNDTIVLQEKIVQKQIEQFDSLIESLKKLTTQLRKKS